MITTVFIIIAVWVTISCVFWIAATVWPRCRIDWLDRLPTWLEPVLLVVLITPGVILVLIKETIEDKIFDYRLKRRRKNQ